MPTSGVTTGAAFGHALHEFFLADAPLVFAFIGVNPFLADAPVRAADADILVRAAEAAHGVPLEMGQREERIVVQKILADGHLLEPLAVRHGEQRGALGVHNVYGREGPAVRLESFPVVFRRVAPVIVVGVRLDDGGVRQALG